MAYTNSWMVGTPNINSPVVTGQIGQPVGNNPNYSNQFNWSDFLTAITDGFGNLTTGMTNALSNGLGATYVNNNDFNAEQAQINRDFQTQSAQTAMKFSHDEADLARQWSSNENSLNRTFNADEAQKTRDWQTEMSNTSYQRAVADMKKAGINPILAYTQGGASTPSGATASGSSGGGASASGVSAAGSQASGSGQFAPTNMLSNLLGVTASLSSAFGQMAESEAFIDFIGNLTGNKSVRSTLDGAGNFFDDLGEKFDSFMGNWLNKGRRASGMYGIFDLIYGYRQMKK